jgi:hypothetical protein
MRRAFLLIIFGLLALLQAPARGQEGSGAPASEPSFVVTIDLDVFRKSVLGGKILAEAKKGAMEELGELGDFEEMKKALGLDPFEDVHGLTVIGDSFEHPEKDVRLILSLGTSTGNLEGLIVAVPGYEFSNHRDYRVYSAAPEGDLKAYGAIHSDASGRKKIVAATDRVQVTAILDALDGKPKQGSSLIEMAKMEDGFYLKVQVLKLPAIDMDEFHANLLKLFRSVSVSIGEKDGKVAVEIVITAADEKSSEQLRQLSQGLAAVFPLATMGEPNEDMKHFVKIFQNSKVTREGNDVRVRVEIPSEDVIEFLRKEADLSI